MKRFLCVAFLLVCLCACFANGNFPLKVFAETNAFSVNAKSAILINSVSGEVIAAQNPDQKLEIASMAKLMTIYLTIEAIDNGEISLSDEIVASENASSMGGSQVFIDSGSKYSVEKMLQSVIMASANDASVALAEHLAGSEKEFTVKMNQTALRLGMTNTQYGNATGLPAPMQFSTATDTAKMLSNLVENKLYHKYSSMWMDELVHPSGRKTEIVNTNKLTRYFKGCDCGKTGFTDEAGYCLASSAVKDDMRLISVVMGAKTAKERFSESVKLLNYGFNNFKNDVILERGAEVGEVEVLKANESVAQVCAGEGFSALVRKGEQPTYDINIELDKNVVAPKSKGDKVGTIIISKDGVVVKEIDAVLCEDVHVITYGDALNKIIKIW